MRSRERNGTSPLSCNIATAASVPAVTTTASPLIPSPAASALPVALPPGRGRVLLNDDHLVLVRRRVVAHDARGRLDRLEADAAAGLGRYRLAWPRGRGALGGADLEHLGSAHGAGLSMAAVAVVVVFVVRGGAGAEGEDAAGAHGEVVGDGAAGQGDGRPAEARVEEGEDEEEAADGAEDDAGHDARVGRGGERAVGGRDDDVVVVVLAGEDGHGCGLGGEGATR